MATRATADDGKGDGHGDGQGGPDAVECLLVRSGRGDVDAFAELYDRLAPRVFGLVTTLVQDPAAAEAVTCEAFVEVWRRSSAYDPERSSATAWTLVVAHRLAVRAGRLAASQTDGLTSRSRADASVLVDAGLSSAQADALRLAYFDGLDHRRISTVVDCDQPVTTLLTGALRLLAPFSPRR